MCFYSLILISNVNFFLVFFLKKILLISERLLLHLHNCDACCWSNLLSVCYHSGSYESSQAQWMTRWRNTRYQLGSWGPWYFLANLSLYHLHIFWVEPAFMKRTNEIQLCIVFSRLVVSDSLWLPELQHTRLPRPLLSPRVCSDSCPLSQWCHPAISSSVVPVSSCPPIHPSIKVFSNESALRIRWPKYWRFSFSISPSKEYSRLISFRIDCLLSRGLSKVFCSTMIPQAKKLTA